MTGPATPPPLSRTAQARRRAALRLATRLCDSPTAARRAVFAADRPDADDPDPAVPALDAVLDGARALGQLTRRSGNPAPVRDPDLTRDLHAWAATHTDTGEPASPDQLPLDRNWPTAARAWCTAHGHATPEPDLTAHTDTRLDADLWILRATTEGRYKIAVVGINHDAPTVHAETPHLDPWEWFDADSVDIHCPGGHGYTWRTGRELVTGNDGTFTTLTAVFGASLDAPFSPCPTCTQHRRGQRATPCGCDGTPWIVCPTCGNRCDVELPTH